MDPTLADLARRIAAAGWTPRPGMAVRDPETGARWRLGMGWRFDNDTALSLSLPMTSVLRALAAGPDLTDEVTALGLLADVFSRLSFAQMEDPPGLVLSRSRDGRRWCMDRDDRFDARDWAFGGSLGEFAARAWLAAHGKEAP